jgi:hypothetical protein
MMKRGPEKSSRPRSLIELVQLTTFTNDLAVNLHL